MKPIVSREIEWCTVLPTARSDILPGVSRTCSEDRVLCLHLEPIKIPTGFTQVEKDTCSALEQVYFHHGNTSPRLPGMLVGKYLISIDDSPYITG